MAFDKLSSAALLLYWVLNTLCLSALSEEISSSTEISVRFLQAPPLLSNLSTATFVYELSRGVRSGRHCSNCSINCKLDGQISTSCAAKNVTFLGLQDGYHTFEVCDKETQVRAGCASYNWTVDTTAPTASITASSSFTSGHNVTVNISFSEPCNLEGGFQCSITNTCNLLVYGAGQVVPQTLTTLQPDLKYSVIVSLSSKEQYGKAILVMDKAFCSDSAGNKFRRGENSSLVVRFDRRRVFVSIRTHVPEKLLELEGQTRTVQATNNYKYLKVYLYFTHPILNTTVDVKSYLNISHGSLQPIIGKSLGNRRFGYLIGNISSADVVTVGLNPDMIISREGTPVSPVTPVTFLFDSKRPAVRLSTSSEMRTTESIIPLSIYFKKPVFGFNFSHINVSGGHLESFQEINRSFYMVNIQASSGAVSISIPENVTLDVAGNKNLPSDVIQVRHYSIPVISTVVAIFVTASFLVTSLVAGLLTVSTSSLQSAGAFSKTPPLLISEPTRNVFRIACYIQVFALSRWLPVTTPVEYYEFTVDLKWSIPYLHLPWEKTHTHPTILGPSNPTSSSFATSEFNDSVTTERTLLEKQGLDKASVVYAAPLTASEYRSFFERQIYIPEAQYISQPRDTEGWRDFWRSMFWLGIVSGSLLLLHALLLLVLKFRSSSHQERLYGALIFPRFEIFLIILAIPCICKAPGSIIKGGTPLGKALGILLLGLASLFQLALFIFLSIGITFGILLQYKEVHQVGQKFHWYQELIRVTLGPGKRGQWTWKSDNGNGESSSINLTKFGPIFEDLRGPPKYMLSQISGASSSSLRRADRIIASDDETEDAEAPIIQKLFGILRIYYTLLESLKRFCFGILAGLFSHRTHSKGPATILLCITSFQLFFLVLKKPFIKKKVQLAEIISIACQVGIFATLVLLLDTNFSISAEKGIGIFMVLLFLVGYLALMVNEWYALYKQVEQLDMRDNSLRVGLKTATIGLLLFFFPEKLVRKLDSRLLQQNSNGGDGSRESSRETENSIPSIRGERQMSSGSRSSSGTDKAWIRQLREMARFSFGREKKGSNNTTSTSGGGGDPSASQSTWSGFWAKNRSGSSSSTDPKAKKNSKGLYKDLEDIFASSSK